jgi:hypothetical protein
MMRMTMRKMMNDDDGRGKKGWAATQSHDE